MGLSFYAKHFFLAYPLFLLAEEAQKKKLGKKKSACKKFRRVRAATNAPRVGLAVAFWKKRRKNFHSLRTKPFNKSKFEISNVPRLNDIHRALFDGYQRRILNYLIRDGELKAALDILFHKRIFRTLDAHLFRNSVERHH